MNEKAQKSIRTVANSAPWVQTELGEVVRIRSGGTPDMSNPAYWGGDVPWLSAKDLKSFWLSDSQIKLSRLGAKSGTRLAQPGTVLILVRGMTLLKDVPIGVATKEITFNQDIKALEPIDGVEGAFLALYLVNVKQRLMGLVSHAGHGTGRLSTDILESFPLLLPSLEEQRRISGLLTVWDRAIELAARLIAAKRRRKQALMQQLLTGTRRFPRCNGKWRELRLRDVFEPVYRSVTPNVKAVLSISSRKGFERQEDKFSKVIAGKNLGNYVLLYKGEFAYNKGNSKTYPQGCVFRLNDYEEAAVPNVYFCFSIRDLTQADSDFYRQYFEAGLLNDGLRGLINTGVRNNGLLNIYEDDFYELRVVLPPIEEQRRIADLLCCCDDEIGSLCQKLDALKQQKIGLMQRLLVGKIRILKGGGRG